MAPVDVDLTIPGGQPNSTPPFNDAFIGLGRSCTSAERRDEALAPPETAKRLPPGNPATHFCLPTAARLAAQ